MVDDVGVTEVEGWAQEFSQVEALLWPRFGRREPRARAVGYVRSLMAPLERKNGWTISEATGGQQPPTPMPTTRGAELAAVPLEPGQQTVGFTVTVVWELT